MNEDHHNWVIPVCGYPNKWNENEMKWLKSCWFNSTLEAVLMPLTWTKSVCSVYVSCSTAFLQQEVLLVSQWKLRVSHYIGDPCHLLWLMTQLSKFKLNRFNSDSSRLFENMDSNQLMTQAKTLTQESTIDSTQSRNTSLVGTMLLSVWEDPSVGLRFKERPLVDTLHSGRYWDHHPARKVSHREECRTHPYTRYNLPSYGSHPQPSVIWTSIAGHTCWRAKTIL